MDYEQRKQGLKEIIRIYIAPRRSPRGMCSRHTRHTFYRGYLMGYLEGCVDNQRRVYERLTTATR